MKPAGQPRPAKGFDVYTSKTEASGVVQALERAWWTIRERHPELPPVVVLVGPGDCGKRTIWGHFARERWTKAGAKVAVHEIMIAGESLARPPAETIGTLLHEAAHALGAVRGIKDVSRGSRYHNRRYKLLAEEVGLEVALAPSIGWSVTKMRPETARGYAAEIEALSVAQQATERAFRRSPPAEEKPPRASRSKMSCECPRSISVAPGVAAEGPIVCGVCVTEFVADE